MFHYLNKQTTHLKRFKIKTIGINIVIPMQIMTDISDKDIITGCPPVLIYLKKNLTKKT